MSTQPPPGDPPPPPDPPNLSVKGKWGVAPSTSPQLTRKTFRQNPGPLVWVTLAAVLATIVVVLVLFV